MLCLKVITLLVLAWIATKICGNEIEILQNGDVSVYECVSQILRNEKNMIYLPVCNSNTSDVSPFILNNPAVLLNPCKISPNTLKQKPYFYIFELNDDIFDLILIHKLDLETWNPTAKMVLYQPPSQQFEQFHELELFLKKNYIINFIILLNADEALVWSETDLSIIYSNFNQTFLRKHLINNCDEKILKKISFTEKKYSNFQLLTTRIVAVGVKPYVLNVNLKIEPGIEVEMFNLIAKFLNMSIIYVKNPFTSWGKKSGGKWVGGSLSLLEKEEADVLIGRPMAFNYIKISFQI